MTLNTSSLVLAAHFTLTQLGAAALLSATESDGRFRQLGCVSWLDADNPQRGIRVEYWIDSCDSDGNTFLAIAQPMILDGSQTYALAVILGDASEGTA